MVRLYKQQRSGRLQFKRYSNDSRDRAIHEIQTGSLSLCEAARMYGVPKATLSAHVRGRTKKKYGGQTTFSEFEESGFVNFVVSCSDWGFPVTVFDLRVFVQTYLNNLGRHVPKFRNNLPGTDWGNSFLRRHSAELKQRIATNISLARSSLTVESVTRYFDNLGANLAGVPPENITNYDETNLSENPGYAKVITRRKAKYVHRVMNQSKAATSIMFAGSADGVLLPPYVVYKSKKCIEDAWRQNGPKGYPACDKRECCKAGVRFSRTTSGWFDSATFSDWFHHIYLPHATQLNGPKVIIGDNLNSHFTQDVLRSASRHNIRFICLPPNSTHLLQPLDVAFFRPLKTHWRHILHEYKVVNLKNATVPKSVFPRLLTQLMAAISTNVEMNLQSGFRACGIYPFDKERALRRLPDFHDIDPDGMQAEEERRQALIADTVREVLSRHRQEMCASSRRRRVVLSPGKSLATQDVDDYPSGVPDEEDALSDADGSNDEVVTTNNHINSGDEGWLSDEETTSVIDPIQPSTRQSFESPFLDKPPSNIEDVEEGGFVAAVYKDSWYVGIVEAISAIKRDVRLRFLHPPGPNTEFKFPAATDRAWIRYEDVLCFITERVTKKQRCYVLTGDVMDDIEMLCVSKMSVRY